MPSYTIFACVTQRRIYQVAATGIERAKELVREEYNFLEYDVIDDEVDDVTVED